MNYTCRHQNMLLPENDGNSKTSSDGRFGGGIHDAVVLNKVSKHPRRYSEMVNKCVTKLQEDCYLLKH